MSGSNYNRLARIRHQQSAINIKNFDSYLTQQEVTNTYSYLERQASADVLKEKKEPDFPSLRTYSKAQLRKPKVPVRTTGGPYGSDSAN